MPDPIVIADEFSQRMPWELSPGEYDLMCKSLEAGTGVDAAVFSGGRSLLFESLDATLADMTLSEKRAAFWQLVPKVDVRSIIHMWNEQSSFGDEWASASSETAAPPVQDITLARKYAEVAHYRDTRQRSDMLMRGNTTIDPEKQLEAMGARRIIHNVDRDLFSGDRTLFAGRMSGVLSQMLSRYPTHVANIADLGGDIINSRNFVNDAAATISNYGGTLTDCLYNPLLQADIEDLWSTAERFVQPVNVQNVDGNLFPRGVTAGIPVTAVRTGFGDIRLHTDPNCKVGWAAPAVAVGNATYRPPAPTPVTVSAGGSGGTIPTGKYYYKVSAVNEYGESIATAASGAVSVTEGEVVTVSITQASTNTPTGYRIYRSAVNPSPDDNSDCRYLYFGLYVDGTDTFVDDGTWVPGCSQMYMVTQLPDQESVVYARYTPLIKKNFAETDWSKPFGLNLSGACCVILPKFIWIWKNVRTRQDKDAGWDPLGLDSA